MSPNYYLDNNYESLYNDSLWCRCMTWPLTYINCANTYDVILLLPNRIFTENALDGISLGSIRYVFQQLYFILPAEALTGKLFNERPTILITTRCLEPNVIKEGETPLFGTTDAEQF